MKSYLLLLIVSLTLAGCAGGGGTTHEPPQRIEAGRPTIIDLTVSVWGYGSGSMTKRYQDVICYYQTAGQSEFTALPMRPISDFQEVQPKTKQGLFRCEMPAFQKMDQAVKYYFEFKFDGTPQRRKEVMVPIMDMKERQQAGTRTRQKGSLTPLVNTKRR